jgi:hypothetical protein
MVVRCDTSDFCYSAGEAMRSKFLILLFGAVAGLTATVRAQRTVIPSTPEGLLVQFRSSDEKVLEQTSTLLKLSTPINQSLCTDFDKVESQPAKLLKGVQGVIVAVPSKMCQTLFLVPLLKVEDHWEAIAPIAVIGHYHTPTFEVRELIAPGEQEVIVRDHDVDWGTGIQQWNMTIYKLVGDRMQIVFDEPEYLHFFAPPRANSDKVGDQYQRSRYTFTHEENTEGVLSILETRTETFGSRKMTVYRSYVWEPSAGIFRMLGSEPTN